MNLFATTFPDHKLPKNATNWTTIMGRYRSGVIESVAYPGGNTIIGGGEVGV